MKVRTAETSGGDIYLVHGEYGGDTAYGLQRDREAFAELALAFLRTHPQDEHTARELTLYEWDEVMAGRWLMAGEVSPGLRWHDMAAAALFGEITYEYPGDWVVKLHEQRRAG